MTDDKIRWEDPPLPQNRRGPWLIPTLRKLRKRPGEWARVREYRQSASASRAVNAIHANYPGFEATVRKIDGRSVLYIRYVGEGGDAD